MLEAFSREKFRILPFSGGVYAGMIVNFTPSPRPALRAAAWLVLGIFATGSLTAFAASSWRGRPAKVRTVVYGFAADPMAADALRPVERTFLDKAAELSREQMQLARLAVSQAASSDVRSYAQQLVEDHRQINDSMEAMRRRKGARLEQKPVEAVSDKYEQLTGKSGADFDREFIRIAAERESSALRLFEEVLADATDTDVRDLIGSYLPMLREHQNRGTELKKIFE